MITRTLSHQIEVEELKKSNKVLSALTITLSVLTMILSVMVVWLVLGGAL